MEPRAIGRPAPSSREARPPSVRTKRRLARLPPALRPLWPYAKRLYTLGTACIAPLTRMIGWSFATPAPRRVVQSVENLASREEGTYVIGREAERLERLAPDGVPPRHPTFVREAIEDVPRVAVAEIPRGRVLGPGRAIITASGSLVHELSSYLGTQTADQHPVFLHPFPESPTKVPGRVGVLAARCDAAYYHFLIDVIPRLELLEALTVPVEQLYMPTSLSFQHQLVELLGIEPERVIDSDRIRHIQAETLVVPGLPDTHLRTPPWVVEFLRRRLLPPTLGLRPGRRIYLTRGDQRGSRIVQNESEVVDALGERGFTVLNPGTMPVVNQIAAFAEAEVIVAPHGGALTNLAFASPGATVVELFAPDYVQGCYWKLSQCVPGLEYHYVVGAGRSPSDGRMLGVDSDIAVDPAVILDTLDRVGSAAGRPERTAT